jgi:regulator of sirC expression with transglutaminase-like and TPR domain
LCGPSPSRVSPSPGPAILDGVNFAAYAAQPDDELDLLDGALLIAADARPGLDRDAVLGDLEALAEPLRKRGLAELPVSAQARVLADHLFVGVGFHGNDADYYDPKNSFLDEVIARRTGIPISLSVLYVEVARRAGVSASPVGFPGHFLVRIDDPERRLVVDPFHGGGALDEVALADLLRRSGSKLRYSSDLIAPTPVRQVVARMLMNLRGIYASRGDFSRLLVVIDHLIDLLPSSIEELRERGFLLGRLGAPAAAVEDLTRYVEEFPHADDVPEVKRWIERLATRPDIEN